MSDLLTWSPIPLGRWFGTTVRIHALLILFVALRLLTAPFGPGGLGATAATIALLLATLALHELAHAATAAFLDCEQEDARIWPLGSLVVPSATQRGADYMLVAIAGPVVSGGLAVGVAAGLGMFANAQFVWNPFGDDLDAGAPWIGDARAAPLSAIWLAGWFGHLNYIVFLANLLPALPFDGGRLFRAFLANTSLGAGRDGMIAPWTARTTAAILFLIGVVRLLVSGHWDGLTIISLAILIEFFVRAESRILEDGGYFDEGVFGYDFSEGYTSLERSDPPRVRPDRESALKRWRRRRSEKRRRRRMMQQLAEERRMDEILEKLYQKGRSALSREEQRFLVRVSARYRNRQNTKD